MMPRRKVPTQLVRLGRDTVEQLRERYGWVPLDRAVKRLLADLSSKQVEIPNGKQRGSA
jgi:hypothetical protein